jgi:hypothetical protein
MPDKVTTLVKTPERNVSDADNYRLILFRIPLVDFGLFVSLWKKIELFETNNALPAGLATAVEGPVDPDEVNKGSGRTYVFTLLRYAKFLATDLPELLQLAFEERFASEHMAAYCSRLLETRDPASVAGELSLLGCAAEQMVPGLDRTAIFAAIKALGGRKKKRQGDSELVLFSKEELESAFPDLIARLKGGV